MRLSAGSEGIKNEFLRAEFTVRLFISAAEHVEGVEDVGQLQCGEIEDASGDEGVQFGVRDTLEGQAAFDDARRNAVAGTDDGDDRDDEDEENGER